MKQINPAKDIVKGLPLHKPSNQEFGYKVYRVGPGDHGFLINPSLSRKVGTTYLFTVKVSFFDHMDAIPLDNILLPGSKRMNVEAIGEGEIELSFRTPMLMSNFVAFIGDSIKDLYMEEYLYISTTKRGAQDKVSKCPTKASASTEFSHQNTSLTLRSQEERVLRVVLDPSKEHHISYHVIIKSRTGMIGSYKGEVDVRYPTKTIFKTLHDNGSNKPTDNTQDGDVKDKSQRNHSDDASKTSDCHRKGKGDSINVLILAAVAGLGFVCLIKLSVSFYVLITNSRRRSSSEATEGSNVALVSNSSKILPVEADDGGDYHDNQRASNSREQPVIRYSSNSHESQQMGFHLK
eukprot:TRINITY_DN3685_c0_g1_i9.p1 TRINITY_DN3685_c0_g1~~TRINITY_DN3685_c0_g1_i9.p1  ORF type:complete len:349 (+),score=41.81 TRINITY_DN3685_c0_g1_i9:526-1572(+)